MAAVPHAGDIDVEASAPVAAGPMAAAGEYMQWPGRDYIPAALTMSAANSVSIDVRRPASAGL